MFKTLKQIGMFDEANRLRKLIKLGDPLEKLEHAINWRMFESILTRVFAKEPKGAGGRPPYSSLMLLRY